MNVGKPQRIHRVEPVRDPVPREQPERRPAPEQPPAPQPVKVAR